ncbi:MAG: hypothetical protein D3910_07095 [Candidatus Electrothrix sp. ATG2]|nr:hypothetical protein [Candidatus Electrothrix sp. ATG2]
MSGIYFYLQPYKSAHFFAAGLVSLSCLIRYEGWILSVLFVIDLAFKKNKISFKENAALIFSFLSGIIFHLFFMFLFKVEPIIGGPLANTGPVFNTNIMKCHDIVHSLYNFLLGSFFILSAGNRCIVFIVLFAFIVGYFEFKKNQFPHKKILTIFILVLISVSVFRITKSGMTDRMLLFPTLFILFFVAIGFGKLEKIWNKYPVILWVERLLLIFVIITYARNAHHGVKNMALMFAPEYNASKFLEKNYSKLKVLIFPRSLDNPWGESAISAIVGNSLKLKINDNVFSIDMLSQDDKNDLNVFIMQHNIDYIMKYNKLNGTYFLTKTGEL